MTELVTDLAATPALLTAWATVVIATATVTFPAITCVLIWRGLGQMRRSSDERAKDRRETREQDLRRQEQDRRRHEEAMDEGRKRHDEAMTALRELIARTAPTGNGAGAD